MKEQIISELRKLSTTRTAYALLAALVAVVGLGTVAVITDGPPSIGVPLERQAFMNVALSITPLFALLLGIRSFTDEFRFGSIVPTLLANPRRGQILAAKGMAAGAGGVVLALTATAGATAIGVPLLLADGWDAAVSPGPMMQVVGRLIAATMLWTTIGVGLGLAVRHQVAAVAGALVWMVAGEGIVADFLPDIARYFPGAAGFSVVGINAGDLLAPAAAAMLLGGYAMLAIVAGGALMRRRDIT
jgi:ABC-type transport system involved in multi-copper enzyme maturation permease subunit